MVAQSSPETITTAMSKDAIAIFKRILDENREKIEAILGDFIKTILEEALKEVQALVETFLEEVPYVTDEQGEALKRDLVEDILEDLVNGEFSTVEALRKAVQEIRETLQQGEFRFEMTEIPGLLELGQAEIENAAWQAAQDAFRTFWSDLKLSKQSALEIDFRREFQRLTADVSPKENSK